MADRDYITVSELNFYINRIFGAEELLHNVPVVGEVSGCSVVKGNCYFTLKDSSAQIRIVYFNTTNKYIPSNGEQVLVRGYVDYYEPTGVVSVKAYEITPFGIGIMHAKLLELKEKLSKEGLFDETHKKIIPQYPVNVGIITSVKGAALQDIFSTIYKNNSKQNISVIDVRVQGDNCVNDILTALNYADAYGFDVILLARGGGSFEDLYPFNDERLVRMIYSLKTPLISAIGHETDYTLCDFVSDYRAITPTAGAEKISVDANKQNEQIITLAAKIKNIVIDKYKSEVDKIKTLTEDIADAAFETVNARTNNIAHLLGIAKIELEHNYKIKQDKINHMVELLDNLNPTKLLEKGYYKVLYQNKSIDSFSHVNIGDIIEIIGLKEKITASVCKKENI